DLVFDTVIPRTTRVAEAPSFGKAIIEYDPYSPAASAYEVLAQETLARINSLGTEVSGQNPGDGQAPNQIGSPSVA
ncbi:MAG: ParA family protein, partial [Verrucomicrobiae bacterium]|nr:ParA family protein [Verrucomicrobiae bacterium]